VPQQWRTISMTDLLTLTPHDIWVFVVGLFAGFLAGFGRYHFTLSISGREVIKKGSYITKDEVQRLYIKKENIVSSLYRDSTVQDIDGLIEFGQKINSGDMKIGNAYMSQVHTYISTSISFRENGLTG
jgi:hypothetical protein